MAKPSRKPKKTKKNIDLKHYRYGPVLVSEPWFVFQRWRESTNIEKTRKKPYKPKTVGLSIAKPSRKPKKTKKTIDSRHYR